MPGPRAVSMVTVKMLRWPGHSRAPPARVDIEACWGGRGLPLTGEDAPACIPVNQRCHPAGRQRGDLKAVAEAEGGSGNRGVLDGSGGAAPQPEEAPASPSSGLLLGALCINHRSENVCSSFTPCTFQAGTQLCPVPSAALALSFAIYAGPRRA